MNNLLWRVVKVTAAAGAVSGVGALFLALYGEVSRRTYSTILGFSSGVMIGVSTLVLLPEGLAVGTFPMVIGGLLLGGLFVTFLEVVIPHMEPHFGAQDYSPGLGDAFLLAVAVAIHNIPEGLAMGLGFVAGEQMGPRLAVAIAFQNIPEGLAISLPLRRNGVNKWYAVIFATLSGMSEVIGAAVAVICAGWARFVLPLGLAFAAGALLFVTADQLIPESHKHGESMIPSWGVTLGFVLVILIDWVGEGL